ncbi:MAG: gliding motility-associated C-terminal domain-containing protein [Bacteroidales bacterium]|nr:gliding motility-associated C-terminal domain-containing protein [Bacteroidales bacterium]
MRLSIRNIVCAVVMILTGADLHAQGWKYSQHFAVTKRCEVKGLTLDSDSNMYVTLYHREDVTHSGPFGTAVYPTRGKQDIEIVKLMADGDTLWHRTIGGVDSDYPSMVTLDQNEDPYICGHYRLADIFIQGNTLPTYDGYDIFLAKFTSEGGDGFARRVAFGPGDDLVDEVVIDKLGNVYMIGSYQDSIFFDHDTLVAQQSSYNMFLAKFNSNGGFRWAKNLESTDETGNTKLIELTITSNTEIYLGGFFLGDLTMGSKTISSLGTLEEDLMLIKVDSTGTPIWVRTGGSDDKDDRLNGITSDRYGNIYLTGYFSGEARLDSTGMGLRNSSPLQSAGGWDMLMAKYNKNGTLIWKARNGDVQNDNAYGAKVHENIVQFTGYIAGEVSFNTTTIKTSDPGNEDTGFFIYDTEGNPITAFSIPGNGEDRGTFIEYDLNGNTYIGGSFSSDTLHIGNDHLVKNVGSTMDGFVAKYKNPFTAAFTDIQGVGCSGESNGRLVITPYFGIEPYTYSWSHNGELNDSVASGLGAGIYTVTITDSRAVTAENTYELIDPAPLVIQAGITNVSCYPEDGPSSDGAIDITVTGGIIADDYEYIWQALSGSGVNATSQDQSTLTAGEYVVTVTDDYGCWEDDTLLIVQPDPIMFTGSVVTAATTGGGSDGAIDLNPSGGNDVSPYVFLWSNAESTEDISGLTAGSYSVLLTDSKGCAADTSFLVYDVDAFLAFIANKVNVDCKGNSTGSATVGTAGGSGSYTYEWEDALGNPIPGDNSITGVSAGTYYVTVTDNSDARTAQASAIISEPALVLSSGVIGTNLDCNGDNSGIADLTVTGGTLPYSFTWSNGSLIEDLVNVAANTYTYTVTDKNGCLTEGSVIITQPSAMDISISVAASILCNGESTGSLTALATGGEGIKSYIWDDPGTQTDPTATDLGAGLYTVIATDQNGCSVEDSYQLTEPAELTLAETHFNVSCYGEGDASINLIPAGGTPSYNYDWTGGLPPQQDHTNIPAGTYTVIVTDANNCEAELTVETTEPIQLELLSVSITDVVCPEGSTGEIQVSASGGTGTISYSINGGDDLAESAVFSDLSAGTYSVLAADENGCMTAATETEIIGPEPWDLDTTIVHAGTDSSGVVTLTALGATAPYSYTLVLLTDENTNSTGEFTQLHAGDYTAYVTDVNLCISETLYITIHEDSIPSINEELLIYSAFSPNNDGKNDVWNIRNIDLYPDCIVVILNSWGTKVFESPTGYPEPWDGTYNERELPAGTYYYLIDPGDGSDAFTGPVSIVR